MEILLNLNDLEKLNLTPSLYCYLASLYFEQPYPNASNKLKGHMNVKLEELGYVRLRDGEVALKGKTSAIFNIVTKKPVKVQEDWIEEWRGLFPKGVKSGGRPVRGDKQGVAKKLRTFVRLNPSITKEQIIAATRQYVYECSLNSYKFMICADYFINKNNSSMLGAMIEDVADRGSSLANTESGGGSSWHKEI